MHDLIEQLNNKYQDVITLNEEHKIYKVTELYAANPIKTLYFDFSQNIPSSEVALDEYHQEYIMTPYYETTGSIQWNHYIYFVHNIESYDNPFAIQKNKDYARKTILNKEQFEKFLSEGNNVNNFYEEQTTQVEDLIGEWQSQLLYNNLSMVYDKTPVSRLTETLFNQEEQEAQVPEEDVTDLATEFPDAIDSFIKTVHLNNYRDFPNLIEKNVKKVNLIHGVNGSGKTSFLEAIEAVTCGGKTQRNPTKVEVNTEVLELAFATVNTRVNHSNEIYKNRDKKWYGSTNEIGNILFKNFNRFNFYHADAASAIEDGVDINQVIKNIVLGKEISRLERRINDSKREFEREQRSLNKQSTEVSQQITSVHAEIEKLTSEESGLEAINIEFNKLLNVLHWKKEFPNENKAYQEAFINIAYLTEHLNTIHKLSESSKILDLSLIEKLNANLEKDNEILITSIKSINNTNERKNVFTNKIEGLSLKLSNVKKLSEWLNLKDIDKLSGLEEELKKRKNESQLLIDIFQHDTPFKPSSLTLDQDKKLVEYQIELTKTYDEYMNKKEALSEQLTKLEEKTGTINTFKSNLQEYATKVLSVNDDKTHCPVCYSKFPEADLMNLIKDITLQVETIERINKLKKTIEDLENDILRINQEKSKINELVFLGKKLISTESIELHTINSIIQVIIEAQNRLKKLNIKISNLEEIKRFFSSRGITEKEFFDLTSAYENNYADMYGPLTQGTLEIIRSNYIADLASQEDSLQKFSTEITTLEKDITRIKDDWGIYINSYQDLLQYFSQLVYNVSQLKKEKQLMLTYIEPESFDVAYLVQTTSLLSVNAKQFADLLIANNKKSSALESLHRTLEDDAKTLEDITENLETLNNSIDILSGLEPSSTRLEAFFRDNTQSILEVFMMIHAPQEFDGLIFGDEIKLKRKRTQEFEPISKISTGQKSALALAIFLTMNRNAINAPRYILFDDPVSNTDDINILAFFDFLRDLSLSGKRQIFFATANSKIANLFKKKFDFLGDEFEDIQLSR